MDNGSSMNDWVSNHGVSNDRVSNDRVDWCWWVCHSLVFDISNVTTIASSISGVVNDLDAAIRQSHPVVSGHGCTIRSFILAKVGTRVLILNTILKSIRLVWLSMDWGMDDGSSVNDGGCVDDGSSVHNGGWVNRGRMEHWCWVEGGGAGSGHGSNENSGLGKHFWKLCCCWLSVELLVCN